MTRLHRLEPLPTGAAFASTGRLTFPAGYFQYPANWHRLLVHGSKSLSRVYSVLALILLCMGCLSLSPCHAQTVTPASESFPTSVRIVLPDGVRLVLKPEPETERVAISLFVRMEPDVTPAQAAIGEMTARALFSGNTNRTQNGILTIAGEVGGSLDVLHTLHYVAATYVLTPPQLPEAAHLICDCLKNADFTPDSLRRAFEACRQERLAHQEEGFAAGYDALCRLLGRPYPEETALRRVTQIQAQDYFRRHYVPAQTVIAVVGKFNPDRVVGFFRAFLADYNRPSTIRRFSDPTALTPIVPVPVLSLPAPGMSAYVLVGAESPLVTTEDYPAFTILQALLGSGHASRLFRQARETLGLGYEVGALYPVERAEPLITFLQWNPRRTLNAAQVPAPDAVRKLLETLLDSLVSEPPSDAELQRARSLAIGSDALHHERVRDRAFYLGWYEAMGRGFAYDADFPHQLATVTREEVLRVARTYLKSRAAVLVVPKAE